MYYFASVTIIVVIGLVCLMKRKRPQRQAVGPINPYANKPQTQTSDSATIVRLRQNLRLKVGYNEETIDRLIGLERERMPAAPLSTLMEAAIERWERENR
jgi:hypothetical protein